MLIPRSLRGIAAAAALAALVLPAAAHAQVVTTDGTISFDVTAGLPTYSNPSSVSAFNLDPATTANYGSVFIQQGTSGADSIEQVGATNSGNGIYTGTDTANGGVAPQTASGAYALGYSEATAGGYLEAYTFDNTTGTQIAETYQGILLGNVSAATTIYVAATNPEGGGTLATISGADILANAAANGVTSYGGNSYYLNIGANSGDFGAVILETSTGGPLAATELASSTVAQLGVVPSPSGAPMPALAGTPLGLALFGLAGLTGKLRRRKAHAA